mmetsp:Transcript_56280/g.163191  ORF Transcript_56280/g.163191 Transcript_56280/m.163191 type:complete len:233 (+) Transcript_56280:768-1466(+)
MSISRARCPSASPLRSGSGSRGRSSSRCRCRPLRGPRARSGNSSEPRPRGRRLSRPPRPSLGPPMERRRLTRGPTEARQPPWRLWRPRRPRRLWLPLRLWATARRRWPKPPALRRCGATTARGVSPPWAASSAPSSPRTAMWANSARKSPHSSSAPRPLRPVIPCAAPPCAGRARTRAAPTRAARPTKRRGRRGRQGRHVLRRRNARRRRRSRFRASAAPKRATRIRSRPGT